MTTVDPATGERSGDGEPLATLKRTRMRAGGFCGPNYCSFTVFSGVFGPFYCVFLCFFCVFFVFFLLGFGAFVVMRRS
jgi:hypothetical protein